MFEVILKKVKETTNTVRFDNADDSNLKVIYIQKDAFSGSVPGEITVTVN